MAVVLAVLASTDGTPAVIGHRGAPSLAPENTELSFSCAASVGADAIECDLRLTKDGAVVCHHDKSTGRVWEKDLEISASTLGQLQSLSLSHGFRVAFPRFVNARIPTFAQAVAAMGDAQIFAEVKDGLPTARAVVEQAEMLGVTHRLTILSYHKDVVEYAVGQGLPCALLSNCTAPSQLLEIEIPSGADISVDFRALTAYSVGILHERGKKVYCFGIEGEKGYKAMAAMGVDGVTCNNISFRAIPSQGALAQ